MCQLFTLHFMRSFLDNLVEMSKKSMLEYEFSSVMEPTHSCGYHAVVYTRMKFDMSGMMRKILESACIDRIVPYYTGTDSLLVW